MLSAVIDYGKIIVHYKSLKENWNEKAFLYFEYGHLLKWTNQDYECAIMFRKSAHALEMTEKTSNQIIENGKRYILSGDQFLRARDDSTAAHCFQKAGLMFMSLRPLLSVNLDEYSGSIRGASYAPFFAALCFERSAEIHETRNEFPESTGDYFRASQITCKGRLFSFSYFYLKKAIYTYLKRNGSLNQLQSACPVLGKRTRTHINVIRILRKRLHKSWLDFYKNNKHLGRKWVDERILIDILPFFRSMFTILRDSGNDKESEIFYLEYMNGERELLWRRESYGLWLFYSFLNVITRYGTSLGRWFIVSLIIILAFALLFAVLPNILFVPIAHHPLILSSASFVNVASISDVVSIYKLIVIIESGFGLIMMAVLIHLFFEKTYLR